MTHRYEVDRKLWTDRKGFLHMSDYWQLRCSCGWRGERITKPSTRQSRQRYAAFRAHTREAT